MKDAEHKTDSPSLSSNLEVIIRSQLFFLNYTMKLIKESLVGFDELSKKAQQNIIADVGKHGLDTVEEIANCMFIEELDDIHTIENLKFEKKKFEEIIKTDQKGDGTQTRIARILSQSLPMLFNDIKKPILLNMGAIYIYSILETYIKDALAKIYENKPEILINTQKSMNYEEIVKNRNSILSKLIELSIKDIGYMSIKEINTFFNKNTFKNMNLSKEFDDWDILVKYGDWRNLIVHNNSEFSEEYIKKYKLSDTEQIGKVIFFPDDFNEMFTTVKKFMIYLHFKFVNIFCKDQI